MSIRGFLIVLICAVALGVVARSCGASGVTEAFAGAVTPESVVPSEAPAALEVTSSAGMTWSEVEVFAEGRWLTLPVQGGHCTPPGDGPWRVRAPGHLEALSADSIVELTPDALIEVRGLGDDLDALAAALAARPLGQRLRTSPLVAIERAPDRLACAVRTDRRWSALGRTELEIIADLAGGRRVTLAWKPAPGSRCSVDLEQVLTERRTAPLALQFVDEAGEPVVGARVSYALAAKAVRFRPLDAATGRNCARIDVGLTAQPEGVTDGDGKIRFDGVGLGQTLGVLAWDPNSGAWQRSTIEHDGAQHSLALVNAGVTVTGRLALPDDLPGGVASRADFRIVWRQSIEGVGTGLWVTANAVELRDHPLGADGAFEFATTGPRSGTSARWELTLEVLAPGCALAFSETLTELDSPVDVGELQLERAVPWIRVPSPLTARATSGWVVPLTGDKAPHWGVRAESVGGAMELHLVPAEGAQGYLAIEGGREQALPRPETAPLVFVLRSEAHDDRWFRVVEGSVVEVEAHSVIVQLAIAAAPARLWDVRLAWAGTETTFRTLSPSWAGSTYTDRIFAPRGARLTWGVDPEAGIALDAESVTVTLR